MATEVTVVAESWVPAWAGKHVTASYTPLVRDGAEVVEPQHVRCQCANCGGTFKTDCPQGQARNHIQRFAVTHSQCPAPQGSPNS